MGTLNIPSAVDGNVIPASDHNSLRNALIETFVSRNASWNSINLAGDLGASSLRWKNAYIQKIILGLAANVLTLEEVGSNFVVKLNTTQKLNVGGNTIDFLDGTTLSETGVTTRLSNTYTDGIWEFFINSAERLKLEKDLLTLFEGLTFTQVGTASFFNNLSTDSGASMVFSINGTTKMLVNNDGIDGSYIKANSIVANTKLQSRSIFNDDIALLAVTQQEMAIKPISQTNATTTFTTTSATDVAITDGAAAALTMSFTGSTASGKTAIIRCLGVQGSNSLLNYTGGTVCQISCFRDATEIGRQQFSPGDFPSSSLVFYDSTTSSSRTYTFKAICTGGGTLNLYNAFFIITEV